MYLFDLQGDFLHQNAVHQGQDLLTGAQPVAEGASAARGHAKPQGLDVIAALLQAREETSHHSVAGAHGADHRAAAGGGGKPAAEAEDTVPEGGPAPLEELPEQARRFAGKKWVVLAVCLLLAVLLGTYLSWRRWHQNSNLLENAEIQKEVEVDPNQSFSIQPIEPEGR